jgi:hypothetical protein
MRYSFALFVGSRITLCGFRSFITLSITGGTVGCGQNNIACQADVCRYFYAVYHPCRLVTDDAGGCPSSPLGTPDEDPYPTGSTYMLRCDAGIQACVCTTFGDRPAWRCAPYSFK